MYFSVERAVSFHIPYDPYALIIHVDGSAYDNPGGEGGIAGIVEYPERMNLESHLIFQVGYEETTNQRMELRACIEALKWVRQHAGDLDHPRVIILSDSKYVCDNHRRAQYWKKDKWRNREGRPVENADLWKEILFLIPKLGVRLEINYEQGKSGQIGKEIDKIAKQSARGIAKIEDKGFRGGEVSRTKLPGEASVMYQAANQVEVIRVYRKNALIREKKAEHKIIFEVVSGEGKSVSKHFAYTTHELEDNLHRQHTYRVRFNDNAEYPIILEVIEEVFPPDKPLVDRNAE